MQHNVIQFYLVKRNSIRTSLTKTKNMTNRINNFLSDLVEILCYFDVVI